MLIEEESLPSSQKERCHISKSSYQILLLPLRKTSFRTHADETSFGRRKVIKPKLGRIFRPQIKPIEVAGTLIINLMHQLCSSNAVVKLLLLCLCMFFFVEISVAHRIPALSTIFKAVSHVQCQINTELFNLYTFASILCFLDWYSCVLIHLILMLPELKEDPHLRFERLSFQIFL